MFRISEVYAEYIVDTRFESLESGVVQQAKNLILDTVGVSLAGYKLMRFPQMVVEYMTGLGGASEATIIQGGGKIPAINAAFANASCAHALDMDDGHRFGALHPGSVIVPAAIAAAELSGADTKKLITGIIIGYEVMIRIGVAINPSSLNRGFHITGITGTFGATAAASNIMGLNFKETVGALGMAGLQACGLLQVNHEVEGAKVKPMNPAKAASSGLLSSIFAQKGARGPLEIFEGEDGYLKAITDEVKADVLARDLGRKYEIYNVYIKLYAACRHAHAPIDAAFEALNASQLDISSIEKILVATYPAAIRLAGITNATTISAGRFSIPFSVALALSTGDASAVSYSEKNVSDEHIQSLARRVHIEVGHKWERQYPEKRGATLTIIDRSGGTWTSEVELAKGEPENPASWEEIYKKFWSNVTTLGSSDQAEQLCDIIMHLEDASIQDFVSFLQMK
jgi:2-methylcitrate dehydratase PrpD